MAVQILNEMPDAEVHRGEPVRELLRELNAPRAPGFVRGRLTGRAGFMVITLALHAVAALALIQMQYRKHLKSDPEPMTVSLVEAPTQQAETPPQYTPPENVVYALPAPPDMSFETESITVQPPPAAITTSTAQTVAPPMVESIDYLRAPPPVYPKESQRKREYGTVVLRVLVDAQGHPAQVQIERTSGYERLDMAAREAVEKFLFRPYEVNGVAQPAQVLIPIGFDRRRS